MHSSSSRYLTMILVLFVIHSIVSFLTYRAFSTKRVVSSGSQPVRDVTTEEQRSRGEATLILASHEVVVKSVPIPVIFYMWAGYFGLIGALIFTLYHQIFKNT